MSNLPSEVVVHIEDPLPPIVVEVSEVGLVGPPGTGGGPGQADPRFPSHPYPPPDDFDWAGVIFFYETDPDTGALVDAHEAPEV